jgi:hypothetical protein
MRHAPNHVRSPTSFRLRPEAQVVLTKLCAELGLTKTQAIELLLLEQISPRRLSPSSTGRRKPDARLAEIRHLIQLARSLGGVLRESAPDHLRGGGRDELVSVVAEIHKVMSSLWKARRSHPRSTFAEVP